MRPAFRPNPAEALSSVNRFTPTPRQARNLLLVGLAILLASRFLHEDLAGSALALGFGLVLAGLVFNGFRDLLSGFVKSDDPGRGPGT